jgi:putative ABC transport system permease protein
VINVEAFGWRLPLYLFPGQWLRLVLLALLTALVSAAWPALKLRNAPPASLLKVFADER